MSLQKKRKDFNTLARKSVKNTLWCVNSDFCVTAERLTQEVAIYSICDTGHRIEITTPLMLCIGPSEAHNKVLREQANGFTSLSVEV